MRVLDWIQRRLQATISRACHEAIRQALIEELHDIRHEAQRIALRETAEFVLARIPLECVGFGTKSELRAAAVNAATRDGLHLEFGVFQGESVNHIADLRPDLIVHGFDSFEGIPEPFHFAKAGTFAVDGLPRVRQNVRLIKGWFEDTLPQFLREQSAPCSFIHVDCDLYSSTRTVLTALAPRIRPGTVILFDEFFNFPNWQKHEYAAFMEFVRDNSVCYEFLGTTYRSSQEMRSGCHQVAVRVLSIACGACGTHPDSEEALGNT
jgi:predicted O-methyltransferase YrrM